jgi:acyl carrier protein
MEQNQIKNWILNYIKKKKKINIDEEINFIEKKIFDSLDLMNLILDIEKKYKIKLSQKNFDNPEFFKVSGLSKIISKILKNV